MSIILILQIVNKFQQDQTENDDNINDLDGSTAKTDTTKLSKDDTDNYSTTKTSDSAASSNVKTDQNKLQGNATKTQKVSEEKMNSATDNISADVKEDVKDVVRFKKDSGNAISCVIDLKTIWFNFAAPPRTPITKKIDYTR